MGLWGNKNSETTGGDFDAAAARVTAEVQTESPADAIAADSAAGDRLEIRPEWAEAAARVCFLPAAKLSHPAYALTDEEAEQITPPIQALLQAVADKYAPALVGRMASRHPELFDAIAAVGVLYWQKWRMVSKLRALETRMAADKQQPQERDEAEAFATATVAEAFPKVAERPKVGERTEDGALVI
jgi:hypothetical protein